MSGYDKQYYERNKVKILEKQREYNKGRRAQRRAVQQAYRLAVKEQNPEKNAAERERWNAWKRDWYQRNKEKHAAKGRARQLRMYGFTASLFEALLKFQTGACAICRRPFTSVPHADHCHDTKTPRGLLCGPCNTVEGIIRSIGLPPREFATRLSDYLSCPPVRARERLAEFNIRA